MLRLSPKNFLKAKSFLKESARDVDYKLFQHYFESGTSDSVLSALNRYQNKDGGFGHALEPDVRLSDSSVIATTVALQYLREINVDSSESCVKEAIHYLLNSYDLKIDSWPLIPKSVNQEPHAPWWHYDPATFEKNWNAFSFNPRAEVLGYFWQYSSFVDADFLNKLTDSFMTHIKQYGHQMDYHEMYCCLRLIETREFPNEFKKDCSSIIKERVHDLVEKNPEKWSEYCAKPLWLAPFPSSPLADVLKDAVQMNLDYEIEHQGEDGSWSPFWAWGNNYPEDWEVAKKEWKGYLTVKMLKSLHDFNRIG